MMIGRVKWRRALILLLAVILCAGFFPVKAHADAEMRRAVLGADLEVPTLDGKVKLTIPEGTEFVSASDGGTLVDGVVEWTIKDVAPGEQGSVTLTVKVTASAKDEVVNEATVQIGDRDPEYTGQVKNPVKDQASRIGEDNGDGKGADVHGV